MLSAEEERGLLLRWSRRGDQAALARLVRAFAPLVHKSAARFRKYGLPAEDILQEGNLALVEAAGKFDVGRDVRFATYAIWWVRARMQDYVLRNWSIVRLGSTRERKALFFKLRHVQARLAAGAPLGEDRAALNAQVAGILGAAPDEVFRMDAILRRGDHALNARLLSREEESQGLLPDDRPSPEETAIAADDRRSWSSLLDEALSGLSDRERRIVVARRLAEAGEAPTLGMLGARLGVSTERVRQIEKAALGKMRRALLSRGADPAVLLAEPVASFAAFADGALARAGA